MNTNRVNELVASMKSFGKEKYQKSELLTEMLALQQEIVDLTFNSEHASTADLKIWDVDRHLDQLNQDCGYVANEELQKFKEGSKILSNLIRAEISGNRGEAKAFYALQYSNSKNIILKNVELNDGDLRTELDAVIITPGRIVIIEVKNTGKNIFIDKNGDFYKTGQFLRLDCNIAEKMMFKEGILRKKLSAVGIKNIQISSILVFTNNRIEVQNKYSNIRTCFLSQLPYIIDESKNKNIYSDEEMKEIENRIREVESKEEYPFEFDVEKYKMDFATVMAILEDASAKEEEGECDEIVVRVEGKNTVWDDLARTFKSKYAGNFGNVAAVAAVTIVSMVAASTIWKGGLN